MTKTKQATYPLNLALCSLGRRPYDILLFDINLANKSCTIHRTELKHVKKHELRTEQSLKNIKYFY